MSNKTNVETKASGSFRPLPCLLGKLRERTMARRANPILNHSLQCPPMLVLQDTEIHKEQEVQASHILMY
jgi:hypothetical protein